MFSREAIEKIEEEFTQKRTVAEAEADRRKAEVLAKFPELKAISKEMSAFGMKIFALCMESGAFDRSKIDKLKEENKENYRKFKEILKKNGYPEDYTEVKRECSLCGDVGYIGTKMCNCMKKRVVLEGYRNSGLGKLIKKQRFDNFDIGIYSERRLPDAKTSVREDMQEILDTCIDYAENFSLESPSLLFIGGTGLGKTHLSSAIAGKIIEKGFDVFYDSVPNIVSVAEKERFENLGNESQMQKYFDCDLLIMDDLGTEPNSKTSQSLIYNIINSRALVNSKPTIISTNLSYKKLEKLYDSPVISRLFGEFDVLLFKGEDFRRVSLI